MLEELSENREHRVAGMLEHQPSAASMSKHMVDETPVISPIVQSKMSATTGSNFYYARKGFLVKRGMGILYRPWALRHFVLEVNQTLSYYCGNECKGTLTLDGASIRRVPPEEANGNMYAFEVYNLKIEKMFNKGDVLMMAASSEQERSAWMKCLEAAVQSDLRSRTREGMEYESFRTVSKL